MASFPTAAFSATEEMQFEILRTLPDDGYVPLEKRREYLNKMINYWEEFEDRIPRLSPAEEAWLDEELENLGKRALRAAGTKEYALRKVASIVDNCLKQLENVSRTHNAIPPSEREIFSWLGVVLCYGNARELNSYLRQAELLEENWGGIMFYRLSDSIFLQLVERVARSAAVDAIYYR